MDFFPSLQQHLQEVGFSFDEIMGHEDGGEGGYGEDARFELHGGPPLEELGEGVFGDEGEEQGFGAVFQPYHQGQVSGFLLLAPFFPPPLLHSIFFLAVFFLLLLWTGGAATGG